MKSVFNKNNKDLFRIARNYHELTEAYDKKICTGPYYKGCVRPANEYQHKLTVEYTFKQKQIAISEGSIKGYSEKEVIRAIGEYGRDFL